MPCTIQQLDVTVAFLHVPPIIHCYQSMLEWLCCLRAHPSVLHPLLLTASHQLPLAISDWMKLLPSCTSLRSTPSTPHHFYQSQQHLDNIYTHWNFTHCAYTASKWSFLKFVEDYWKIFFLLTGKAVQPSSKNWRSYLDTAYKGLIAQKTRTANSFIKKTIVLTYSSDLKTFWWRFLVL